MRSASPGSLLWRKVLGRHLEDQIQRLLSKRREQPLNERAAAACPTPLANLNCWKGSGIAKILKRSLLNVIFREMLYMLYVIERTVCPMSVEACRVAELSGSGKEASERRRQKAHWRIRRIEVCKLCRRFPRKRREEREKSAP